MDNATDTTEKPPRLVINRTFGVPIPRARQPYPWKDMRTPEQRKDGSWRYDSFLVECMTKAEYLILRRNVTSSMAYQHRVHEPRYVSARADGGIRVWRVS